MEKSLKSRSCWKQDAKYFLAAVVGIALALDGESFSAQPVGSDRQIAAEETPAGDEYAEKGASVPEPQRPSDRKVSLSAKRMPLKTAIEELCRAADVSLDLDTDGIERFGVTVNTPVTVDLKDVPLETAVRQVIVSLRKPGVYFALDHGKLLVSSIPVIQERFVLKLPDWLRPLYNRGLVARIDEDDRVTEITVGEVVDEDLLAKLKTLPRLRKLGIHVSREITERVLRLGGNRLTDTGLAHLTGMTHLEVLEIPNTGWVDSRMNITDAGLAHVARLTMLRELDIGGLPVTDQGFAHLSGLRELRQLHLGRTQITGNGLEQLAKFPQLESLALGGPWFDDAGMGHVAACGNLKRLFLTYTKIGDDGLRHVGKLEKLERLTLDSRFVTDAGLAHLASLENLSHIELRATRITDEALKHISKIASLTRLDLSASGYPGVRIGRNFTGAGYAHLAAMPGLKTVCLNNADVRWTELRGLKQLNSLSLLMPTMSADDARRLQRALPDTYVSATWGGRSVSPIQFRESTED